MLLLLLSFPLGIFAQRTAVTEAEARTVALNWLNTMDNSQSYQFQDVLTNLDYDIGEDLTFYVIRYSNPAFVIVPASKFVRPILAYSSKNSMSDSFIDRENNGALYLLSSYNKAIEIHVSTATYMELAEEQWTSRSTTRTGTNSNYNGAALLEHYHTSRWIARKQIFNCMTEFDNWPNPSNKDRGNMTCVPLSLSQIAKYFQHPYKGNNTISAYGSNASINHQNSLYDYEIMPFKSGNYGPVDGYPQNPDGSFPPGAFDLYYPYCGDGNITNRDDAPILSQMGQLIFNVGSSARMTWYEGTSLSYSLTAPTRLASNFNYNFLSSNNISTVPLGGNTVLSPSVFKQKIRASILNERPVFFIGFGASSGNGHAFLLDGFQCDDFFHASLGLSGSHDGYYYIFTADANGNYNQLTYIYNQSAAVEIHPNCNLVSDITVNNKTYTSEELEQAQNNITASNTIVQTGAKTFMIGGNSVELTSDFEVELGAELFINIETCGVPKQGH